MAERGPGGQSERVRALREPVPAAEVALRRDEAGDRTAERNRSGVLDAVRALAALMVLAAHASFVANNGYPGPVGTALRQMLGAGVLIFFSLSGYLIAGPFLRALIEGRPLPRIRSYFVRRAARIYPAYWIAFAAVLIFLWPAGGVKPYQFPVHILLLQSSWPVNGEPTSIFFVAYTLGIEAAFYVLVPLVAIALRALHPGPWRPSVLAALVLGAGVASAAWAYIAATRIGIGQTLGERIAEIGLQSWLYFFCPGMLLVIVAAAGPGRGWNAVRRLMAMPWLTLPAAVALWGLAYAMERSHTQIVVGNYQAMFTLAAGLFLGGVLVAGPWIDPVVRVLAPVGLISYGVYLWHDIFIDVLIRHHSGIRGGPAAWVADCLIITAMTLPVAALSWIAVERPSMRWAAAWARRRAVDAGPGIRPAVEPLVRQS
jgi:peptidoglycan/LPS O-acetylase OafA/YrhL